MIDAEHIIKLLDAGYTKEEIDKMGAGTERTGESEKGEIPKNDDTGAESPANNDDETKGALSGEELDPFREEIEEIKKTIKAMQEQNRKNSTFTPPDESKTIIDDLSKNF